MLRASLVLPLLVLALGCGEGSEDPEADEAHDFLARCEVACAVSGDDCLDEEEECVDACLVQTEGLTSACGICVAEQFEVEGQCTGSDPDGNPGSCSCWVEKGKVSDPACSAQCTDAEVE